MLDRVKIYNRQILENCYDEDNEVTYDWCNICGFPAAQIDVRDVKPTYWVKKYDQREEHGINDIDRWLEDMAIEHVTVEHEAELTILSMDADNDELLASILKGKREDANEPATVE